MSGVSASTSPPTIHSLQLNHQRSRCCLYPSSSDLKLHGIGFNGSVRWSRRTRVQCNSSSRPGGSNPGDSDTRNVLDAFFLGKALAEALNERIESTVGEFLSAIGRLQAEQQKQAQDFQEEVLERAKKAKEKAAREAMEAQGLVPKSSTANTSADSNGAASTASSSSTAATARAKSPTTTTAESDPDPTDPVVGVSNDD